MITIDWLRSHIKRANEQGADIVASGDDHIEWRGGCRATVYECTEGSS